MTSRPTIDNPIFWAEFLKRLSFCDVEYDAEIIRSLCEATRNTPEHVLAKLKAHYADNISKAAH